MPAAGAAMPAPGATEPAAGVAEPASGAAIPATTLPPALEPPFVTSPPAIAIPAVGLVGFPAAGAGTPAVLEPAMGIGPGWFVPVGTHRY